MKNRNKRSAVVLNEEELIQQVSLRPILYDRSLKAYRRIGLRHQYWKEVAVSMGATVEECRRRWRSLRDAFSKHFKHMKAEDHSKRKKWVFYDQMSFIAPFLDHSNCDIDELLDDFADNSEDANEDTMIIPSESHDDSQDQMTPIMGNEQCQVEEERKFVASLLRTKNCAVSVEKSDFLPVNEDSPIAESISKDQNEVNTGLGLACYSAGTNTVGDDADGDEKFLLSCAPAMRRLSNRKNALARLKIQQILYDIEFGSHEN